MGELLGDHFLVFTWCMVALTGILVAMRLYVQIMMSRTFRSRATWLQFTLEALVIFAWCSFLSQAIMDTFLRHNEGFESEGTNLAPGREFIQRQTISLKLVYAESALYLNPMYAIKCHMLLFYWTHLIGPWSSMRKTYRCLQATTILVLIAWPLEVLMLIFYCQPISSNWSLDEDKFCGALGNEVVFWFTYAPHVATDLMVYAIPIPVLRSISYPERRQKILAYISFGFGFLACSFAAAQIVTNLVPSANMAMNWTFATMEQTWAMLVVCVPAFKLFIRGWQSRRSGPISVVTNTPDNKSKGSSSAGTKLEKISTNSTKDKSAIHEENDPHQSV